VPRELSFTEIPRSALMEAFKTKPKVKINRALNLARTAAKY